MSCSRRASLAHFSQQHDGTHRDPGFKLMPPPSPIRFFFVAAVNLTSEWHFRVKMEAEIPRCGSGCSCVADGGNCEQSANWQCVLKFRGDESALSKKQADPKGDYVPQRP